MKKRVRIKDIAKLSGVSSGTVDRVLHGRGNVSEKAREAVENVLKEMDYRPNIHLSALSLKKTYDIIVTTPHTSLGEYWDAVHSGIRLAIEQYERINIKTTFLTYDQYNIYSCQDVFAQVLKLSPDAVIIGPTFNEETRKFAKKLNDSDIPYVFVDSTVENTSPLAFYSANHYICGYLMCKLLVSLIPEGSDIGILQAIRVGDRSANTSILRRQGAHDYLTEIEYSNSVHNLLFSVYDSDQNEINMSRFFDKHPNVRGVIVLNSRGNVVSDFLHRHNKLGIKVVCIDLTDANIVSLKDGGIDFLIDQNPNYQGYMAMKTLLENLILKHKSNVENYMPLNIVTKETVDLQQEFNVLQRI